MKQKTNYFTFLILPKSNCSQATFSNYIDSHRVDLSSLTLTARAPSTYFVVVRSFQRHFENEWDLSTLTLRLWPPSEGNKTNGDLTTWRVVGLPNRVCSRQSGNSPGLVLRDVKISLLDSVFRDLWLSLTPFVEVRRGDGTSAGDRSRSLFLRIRTSEVPPSVSTYVPRTTDRRTWDLPLRL